MGSLLRENGKTVTGWMVTDVACDERRTRRDARSHTSEIGEADATLSLACGAGSQTQALSLGTKPTYPALNTLFLGRLQRLSMADERCVQCGECILAQTGGICTVAPGPVTERGRG